MRPEEKTERRLNRMRQIVLNEKQKSKSNAIFTILSGILAGISVTLNNMITTPVSAHLSEINAGTFVHISAFVFSILTVVLAVQWFVAHTRAKREIAKYTELESEYKKKQIRLSALKSAKEDLYKKVDIDRRIKLSDEVIRTIDNAINNPEVSTEAFRKLIDQIKSDALNLRANRLLSGVQEPDTKNSKNHSDKLTRINNSGKIISEKVTTVKATPVRVSGARRPVPSVNLLRKRKDSAKTPA